MMNFVNTTQRVWTYKISRPGTIRCQYNLKRVISPHNIVYNRTFLHNRQRHSIILRGEFHARPKGPDGRQHNRERARAQRSLSRSPSPDFYCEDPQHAPSATEMALMLDKPVLMAVQTRHAVPARGGIAVPDHDPGAAVILRTPPNVPSKARSKGRSTSSVRFESRSPSSSRSTSKGCQLRQQSPAAYNGGRSDLGRSCAWRTDTDGATYYELRVKNAYVDSVPDRRCGRHFNCVARSGIFTYGPDCQNMTRPRK
ncbi:hypothetical protein MTO96_035564 [Rhipicephalus appendiculatus]